VEFLGQDAKGSEVGACVNVIDARLESGRIAASLASGAQG
jgi:hypothetical protein